MIFLSTVVVLWSMAYTINIVMSRRRRTAPLAAPDDLFFVFMIPCLDDELIIGSSLERLLSRIADDFAVLVVDDGSDDGTSDIVLGFDDPRVWLYRRIAPEARKGKGAALNSAFRHLRDTGILGERPSTDVVVVVLDADARLEPDALDEVGPLFRDPAVGAVQIGVRIGEGRERLLDRMQDVELVTFTDVFRRARERAGSVGVGGNGQFARLAALETLGSSPWTACLTEDIDLGIRLRVRGWTNDFCATSHVAEQAVADLSGLLRQRARWFQGRLQCSARIPLVLRSRLPSRAVFDLAYHLASPALVLLVTVPVLVFALSLAAVTWRSPGDLTNVFGRRGGLMLALWYLLAFGLAPFYGFAYWLRDQHVRLWKALAYAHLYSLCSYVWFPAGWMAVARVLGGQRGWATAPRPPEATAAEGRTQQV